MRLPGNPKPAQPRVMDTRWAAAKLALIELVQSTLSENIILRYLRYLKLESKLDPRAGAKHQSDTGLRQHHHAAMLHFLGSLSACQKLVRALVLLLQFSIFAWVLSGNSGNVQWTKWQTREDLGRNANLTRAQEDSKKMTPN